MAHIIVIGAGIGGMSAAYELRGELGNSHRITVIGDGPRFSFNPSNPWLAVGWRTPPQIQVEVGPYLAKKQIEFVPEAASAIDAGHTTVSATLRELNGLSDPQGEMVSALREAEAALERARDAVQAALKARQLTAANREVSYGLAS